MSSKGERPQPDAEGGYPGRDPLVQQFIDAILRDWLQTIDTWRRARNTYKEG